MQVGNLNKGQHNDVQKSLVNLGEVKEACLVPASAATHDEPLHKRRQRIGDLTQTQQSLPRKVYESERELRANKPDYNRVGAIGKGNWGISDKCTSKNIKGELGVTFIPRGARVTRGLRARVLEHHSLAHPHLANVMDVFVLPTFLAVAVEFVPGCNMLQYLEYKGMLHEQEAKFYFQQIAIAIDYLHRMGFGHKELKLENILMNFELDKERRSRAFIKVAGFKMAKHEYRWSKGPTSNFRVHEYLAPEMWGPGYAIGMTAPFDEKASDMWSLGVMLYKLVYGEYPFPRPGRSVDYTTEAEDLCQPVEFFEEPKISTELEDLLEGLLAYDKEKRLSIQDVLEHPWLEKLPQKVKQMNDNLVGGHGVAECYQNRQSATDVAAVLQEARSTTRPERIWQDNEIVEGDVRDDHQWQQMDPEESEEHISVLSCPDSGTQMSMAA